LITVIGARILLSGGRLIDKHRSPETVAKRASRRRGYIVLGLWVVWLLTFPLFFNVSNSGAMMTFLSGALLLIAVGAAFLLHGDAENLLSAWRNYTRSRK